MRSNHRSLTHILFITFLLDVLLFACIGLMDYNDYTVYYVSLEVLLFAWIGLMD